MGSKSEIYEAIPHRPPFLWVDAIVSHNATTMVTEKFISPDLDFFAGHYPGNPIVPGVLLCEAVFQTGALLMAKMLEKAGHTLDAGRKTPVLTRIKSAKFKKAVKPGDTITIQVTHDESIGNAWFFTGKVLVRDKTAVKVKFGCAVTEKNSPAR